MKTIQITEITDDYEKKRIQYNNQAIQKYGEEIIKKINTFWALHKQEIMNGIDIQKIIENDSDNLLNYYPKKTTKTNVLSKVLKRGK